MLLQNLPSTALFVLHSSAQQQGACCHALQSWSGLGLFLRFIGDLGYPPSHGRAHWDCTSPGVINTGSPCKSSAWKAKMKAWHKGTVVPLCQPNHWKAQQHSGKAHQAAQGDKPHLRTHHCHQDRSHFPRRKMSIISFYMPAEKSAAFLYNGW